MRDQSTCDPRSKLALVASIVIVTFFMGTLTRISILFGGFVAFVAVTGGIGVVVWARSLKPVLYLLPILLVLNTVFYAGGTVYWAIQLGPVELSVTGGGIETAVLIAVRLLLLAGVAAWFAATTAAEAFEVGLVKLGVPWSFAFLLSLTLRLVPEMRRRFQVIEDAQRSRGLDLSGGPIARVRVRMPMLLPFFVAVIRYGYELSEALTARGFDSIEDRTSLTEIGHGPADYAVYLLALTLLLGSVLL